jgi:diadenosine tetraphosphatase ApaH/serine/threonine PP2A family protein phosphatase
MRVAIVSDIHANLAALEAVCAEIKERGIATVWCLGDIVGYGAHPKQCIEIIRNLCTIVIAGNHDCGAVGSTSIDGFNRLALEAIYWTRAELADEHRDYLNGLPHTAAADVCTLVHASPFEPSAWHYLVSPRGASKNFIAFATRLCFVGHTHVPVVFGEDGSVNRYTTDGRHIINVGSVGQPRDGNPAAAFGVYDTDASRYEPVRVSYAIEKSAKSIIDAGLPESLAHRLYVGI